MVVLGILSKQHPHSIWCKPCSKYWWEGIQAGTFENNWWKENQDLSRSTFTVICNELHPLISRKDTNLRFLISIEERVTVTIWKLAIKIEYRTLSGPFEIGKSTVRKIVRTPVKNCHESMLKFIKNIQCQLGIE